MGLQIIRADHVAERVVDGELVLYDTQRQTVHALNATAAFVWNACDGSIDEAGVAEALAQRYPESREAIRQDVSEILELFRSQGLLKE